ncbi:TRAP ABC transporter substrate-binding protein [Betaproteobacteria bacterium]|nr:TRAP ABC transporter substrate-binding protein [Betaproteobacteria bacterium]
MKKRVLIIGAIMCAVMGLTYAADAKKPITLKYAHVGIAGEIQTRYADELAALVKEKTNGEIIIQVFPNSQLGGANEMADGIKSGAIAMGHHDFATLGKYLSDISVFNAPYIYRDGEHALKATNPKTSPTLQKVNEKLIKAAGLRVIGSNYRGARHLSAKTAIYSPADLAGKKIRGTPVKLWMSMIKGMGAIPTPVEISELYTALLSGMVDGQENPITNIYTQKFHEVQKFIMMTGHMQAVLSTFINEKAWQSIGEKNQNIMNDCLEEVALRSLKWTKEQEAPVIQKMKDYGITFIDESSGLKNDEFRKSVNAQVAIDFPDWTDYIKEIQSMK